MARECTCRARARGIRGSCSQRRRSWKYRGPSRRLPCVESFACPVVCRYRRMRRSAGRRSIGLRARPRDVRSARGRRRARAFRRRAPEAGGLRRRRRPRRLREERVVLRAQEPGRAAEEVRGAHVRLRPGGRRRDALHGEAQGARRSGHGPGVVPRRRAARPCSEESAADAHAGDRAGREHAARAAGVGAGRRRGALRPRREPARPPRPQGLRPRPLAAQRHHRRSLPGLEPRLGRPLGQHLVHALRRPARAGSRSRPTASSTPRASRGGLTGVLLRGRRLRAPGRRARRPRRSTSRCSSKEKKPNQLIHAGARPRGTPACAGTGEVEPPSHRRLPRSRPSRTAASSMWVDDRLVINHWRQGWLPWKDVARVRARGQAPHKLRLEWTQGPGHGDGALLWKTARCRSSELRSARPRRSGPRSATASTTTSSTGPSSTASSPATGASPGQAPMMPRWAFGLWQSRQRYETQQAEPRRRRRLPLARHPLRHHRAGLVLLDGERLGLARASTPCASPTPTAGSATIHDKHAHLMISVWGKFYPGTENFEAMRTQGFLYQPQPGATGFKRLGRRRRLPLHLLRRVQPRGAASSSGRRSNATSSASGVDAWWLDATEPDLLPTPDARRPARRT